MKRYYIFILIIIAASLTGCYDREIIDSKEGESIDPISNLNYNIIEPVVVFTWDMPANYPSDVVEPVSIVVVVYRNNVKVSTLTLPDAPTTFTYSSYS
ncbi:MAG: DUF4945 domain-containing protein, partial [Bacteroidales bacterium]|nr:DUF4945 domain-containing protein [Bacteroidales bacterium]